MCLRLSKMTQRSTQAVSLDDFPRHDFISQGSKHGIWKANSIQCSPQRATQASRMLIRAGALLFFQSY